MYEPVNLLAGFVALAIAIVLFVAPEPVYRLQFFVHGADTGRQGPYGESRTPSDRERRIIQAIGGLFVLLAIAFLTTPWWP